MMATIAKVLVSILAMAIFVVCLAIAYFRQDQQNMPLLMGAAISMATGAVNYWLGSSSGSDRKTELMSGSPPSPPDAPKPPVP